jgi:predicted permease
MSLARELVRVFTSTKDLEYGRLSYPEYLDVRQRTTTFSGTVAYDTAFVPLSRGRRDVPQLVGAWLVSANFFSVLEVQPTLGRGFHEDEGRVGASPVVVISDSLWQRYFSSNPAVVGTAITLGSSEFTIVGVAPPDFGGTELYFHPDLYVPIAVARTVEVNIPATFLDDRGDRWLTVLGRLKPGVGAREASAELAALARSLEQTYPQTNRNRTALALPEVTARGRLDAGGYEGAALMLALVGFVLLIACANLANLLLSRAASRRKEIAMRLALGASRGRLMRQFLTESVLLSILGAILGLLFGYWGVTYVAGIVRSIMSATDLPLALDVRLDQRVLVFTAVVSGATGIIFGLAPALHATRVDLIPALKAHISTKGLLRRWFTVRDVLMVGQVALSVVVLTVAGLAVQAVVDKQRIDPGFRPDHVLAMTFNPSLIKYDRPQTRRYYHELVERTKALPGVQAVGLAQFLPLAANWGSISLTVDGYQMPAGQDQVTIRNSVVDA